MGNGAGDSRIRKVLFAQSILNTASSIIANPVLPLYYRSAGASMEQLGLLTMLNYVGYAIFEPAFGLLSDRVGRKKIIASAVALNTITILAFTCFKSVQWLYLVAFLHAVCMAGYFAPSRAMIADITPREKRGRSYGSFLTVQSLGRVFGPAIGGFLAYNFSYEHAFYASAALTGVSVLNVAVFFPADKAPRAEAAERPSPRSILTPRTVIFIASRALPFFFMFYSTILTVLLKESPRFHATEADLGLMATTVSIVGVGAQYAAGILLDRIGSVRLIILGFALDGVGYLGYLHADSLASVWLVRLLIGAISPLYNVGMMVAMMELVPSGYYGFAMGLYGLSEDLGGMIGSPTLSAIYNGYGFENTTYFMSFICFFAAAMVWANMRGHKR